MAKKPAAKKVEAKKEAPKSAPKKNVLTEEAFRAVSTMAGFVMSMTKGFASTDATLATFADGTFESAVLACDPYIGKFEIPTDTDLLSDEQKDALVHYLSANYGFKDSAELLKLVLIAAASINNLVKIKKGS